MSGTDEQKIQNNMEGTQVDFYITEDDGGQKNILSTFLKHVPQQGSTVHLRNCKDFENKSKGSYLVDEVHHVIVNNEDSQLRELVVVERIEIFVSEKLG
jgi:hypothetical protein